MDPVVHFEMPYENRDRMVQFYTNVFGWKAQKLGPDMGNYVVVTTIEKDLSPKAHKGGIGGGFFERSKDRPGQYPSVVIGVDDIHAAMKRVNKNGGRVLGEPMAIPGVGDYVAFMDTEGNRVSLLKPQPM